MTPTMHRHLEIQGQLVGHALDQNLGEPHAYLVLAVPLHGPVRVFATTNLAERQIAEAIADRFALALRGTHGSLPIAVGVPQALEALA